MMRMGTKGYTKNAKNVQYGNLYIIQQQRNSHNN